jgi:hypothetical protein
VLLAEFDAVGLGVEDILMAASSCDMSDILLLRPGSRVFAISASTSFQILLWLIVVQLCLLYTEDE